MCPTRWQKKLLKKWSDAYRFSYNNALSIIKSSREEPSPKLETFKWIQDLEVEEKAPSGTYYSKYELRNMVVSGCFREWLQETPFQIRAYSVFECHNRYKTCLSNLSQANIRHFDMNFKTKKKISWTMDVPKDYMYLPRACSDKNCRLSKCETCRFLSKRQFMLYRDMGWMKTSENIPESIMEYDSKIQFDGLHYYLIVPYDKPVKSKSDKKWFCSLDPGVRKFQTMYDPEENQVINIGERACTKMYTHLTHVDKLCSKIDKNHLKKSDFKKRKLKLLQKVQNLQKELRDKVSRYLCNSFHCIVAPKLTKGNDIVGPRRKINTKTVRNMTVLGHSKFIEMLKTKASEYKDVAILNATEEYTSQTCLRCCSRTRTSREIYTCNSCNYRCDRDAIGSINILLKSWGFL